MIEQIRRNQKTIEKVCREFGVHRLEVFGSAANDEYVEGTSDVDFLVEFDVEEMNSDLLTRYLLLNERLESLLGTHVDLVTSNSVRNPYFRESIDKSREPVYEG